MDPSIVRLLLVEDNPGDARLFQEMLREGGDVEWQIDHARKLAKARELLSGGEFDLVVLDLNLPDSGGLETFMALASFLRKLPIVVLSGSDDREDALRAVKSGAQDYLIKDQLTPELLSRSLVYAIERFLLREEMEALAITDDLSGLLNRRGFFTLAEQQVKLARRSRQPMSLFYIDIDDMKGINDQYGHQKGDQAIRTAAGAIRATFRDSDLLSRLGGDEFAVLAIDTPAETQATIYNRLQAKVQELAENQELPFDLSLSVGAAEWNISQTQNLDLLLQQADKAMYRQKEGDDQWEQLPEIDQIPFEEKPPFFQDRLDVLLVEDNPGDARLVEVFLGQSPKEIQITHIDRLEGFRTLRDLDKFSVILLDLTLPDSHGLDTIRAARAFCPETPIVVFTGNDDRTFSLEAIQAGAQDYLVKGDFDAAVLERALQYAVERNNLWKLNQAYLEEIQYSEQILQSIFDNVKVGIFRADQAGRLTFANRVLIDLLGFESLSSLKRIDFMQQVLGLDPQELDNLKTGEREIRGDIFQIQDADGSPLPIRLGISRVVENGRVILTGTVEDYGQQLESEKQLNLQASALDAAANAIIITSLDGTIEWCNQAFTDLTEYSRADVVGKNPRLLNSGVQDQEFYEEMWNALNAGRVWQGELINRKKSGVLYSERMTITPLRSLEGEIEHFIAIKEDITAVRQDQQMLERRLTEVLTFNQVASLGLTAEDENQLISAVTDMVAETIYSDHFGVLLLNRAGTHLVVHSSYIGIPEDLKELEFRIDEGIVGRCAREQETIRIKDVTQEDAYISGTDGVRSELAVPLISEGALIGVINAESRELDHFKLDDIRLLETIATQLGIAIGQIRSHQQEVEQRRKAEALADIALVLNSSLEIEEILDQVLSEIADLIPCTTTSLFLVEKGTARVIRHRGYANLGLVEWLEGFEFELGKSGIPVFDRLALEKRPVLIADTKQVPDWVQFPETSYIRSYLIIPILRSGNLIGFINLDSDQPNAFDPSQIELLVTLANQVSTALENAELYTSQQRQLKFQESLRQIDRAITSSLDLEVTLDVIASELRSRLAVDAVSIYLLDDNGRDLRTALNRGFRSQEGQGLDLNLWDGLPGEIIRKRSPLLISDLGDAGEEILRGQEFKNEGFVTYRGYPILTKGRTTGVIELFQRSSQPAQEDLERFAQTVAHQAAIAIENYSLFSDLEKANLELSLAYDNTLEGWAGALELRDHETEGHSRRVVDLTMELVAEMGLPKKEWVHIRRGALLHDIGKMGVPDAILQKAGPLDEDEMDIMRQHPLYADQWLRPITYLQPALDIPLYHHERWDGTGYPYGLKGKQIPIAARMFALVDVWDALLSDRPYRKAWPKKKVVEHLRKGSGSHFDPEIVEVFLKIVLEEKPLAEKSVPKSTRIPRLFSGVRSGKGVR